MLWPLAPTPCGMTVLQIDRALEDSTMDIINEHGKRFTGQIKAGCLTKQHKIVIEMRNDKSSA